MGNPEVEEFAEMGANILKGVLGRPAPRRLPATVRRSQQRIASIFIFLTKISAKCTC